MPRSFPPQQFHHDVAHNTNFPPQASNEGGSTPPTAFFYILDDNSGFYEVEDISGHYQEEGTP